MHHGYFYRLDCLFYTTRLLLSPQAMYSCTCRLGCLFTMLLYLSMMSLSSLALWMEDRLLFIRQAPALRSSGPFALMHASRLPSIWLIKSGARRAAFTCTVWPSTGIQACSLVEQPPCTHAGRHCMLPPPAHVKDMQQQPHRVNQTGPSLGSLAQRHFMPPGHATWLCPAYNIQQQKAHSLVPSPPAGRRGLKPVAAQHTTAPLGFVTCQPLFLQGSP